MSAPTSITPNGGISNLLTSLKQRAGQAGSGISSWYSGLDPEVRRSLTGGLGGAAIGGLAAGGIAAMTNRDEDERNSVMGPALLGALLGGTAGAAIPTGLDMLDGNIKLKDEEPVHPGTRLENGIVDFGINNAIPLATTGYAAHKNKSNISALMKIIGDNGAVKPTAASALEATITPGRFKGLVGKFNNTRKALVGPQAKASWKALGKPHGRFGLAAIPAALILGVLANRRIQGK